MKRLVKSSDGTNKWHLTYTALLLFNNFAYVSLVYLAKCRITKLLFETGHKRNYKQCDITGHWSHLLGVNGHHVLYGHLHLSGLSHRLSLQLPLCFSKPSTGSNWSCPFDGTLHEPPPSLRSPLACLYHDVFCWCRIRELGLMR